MPNLKAVPQRRVPKTAHAAFTVDAILISVERILEQHGPEALTTNRIADVAGVSIGTLYQYFPNKDALVGALQDRYNEDTIARVRAALVGCETLSMNIVIARVAEAVLSAHSAQRPIHRWLMEWRTLAGGHERYRQTLDALVDVIANFLVARPDVTIDDPRAAAFVLVHTVKGLIEAVSERGSDIDPNSIAMQAIRMLTLFVS